MLYASDIMFATILPGILLFATFAKIHFMESSCSNQELDANFEFITTLIITTFTFCIVIVALILTVEYNKLGTAQQFWEILRGTVVAFLFSLGILITWLFSHITSRKFRISGPVVWAGVTAAFIIFTLPPPPADTDYRKFADATVNSELPWAKIAKRFDDHPFVSSTCGGDTDCRLALRTHVLKRLAKDDRLVGEESPFLVTDAPTANYTTRVAVRTKKKGTVAVAHFNVVPEINFRDPIPMLSERPLTTAHVNVDWRINGPVRERFRTWSKRRLLSGRNNDGSVSEPSPDEIRAVHEKLGIK